MEWYGYGYPAHLLFAAKSLGSKTDHPQKPWLIRLWSSLIPPRQPLHPHEYPHEYPYEYPISMAKNIRRFSWSTRQVRGKSFEPWKQSADQDFAGFALVNCWGSCKLSPSCLLDCLMDSDGFWWVIPTSNRIHQAALLEKMLHCFSALDTSFHLRLATEHEKVSGPGLCGWNPFSPCQKRLVHGPTWA